MNYKFILLFILILSGCLYEPALQNKNYNFSFDSISHEGENNINEIVKSNLSKKTSGIKKYDINFTTKKEREVISSNAKGDPTIYKLKIYLNYVVFNNGDEFLKDTIEKQTTYNNITDKFELNKFEKNILNSISENISDEILINIISRE
tara:strand:- start:4279 stop:4725 length:447 start_codon:yes stop_codon:yes gene_type:complete